MWPFTSRNKDKLLSEELRSVSVGIFPTDSGRSQLANAYKQDEIAFLNTVQNQNDFLKRINMLREFDPMKNGGIFAAVNLISNSIAQMPWNVKSLKGKEIPDNLYLNHVTDNMITTRFIMVKNLIKDCLIEGNGYCYIYRDEDGYPIRLRYLEPGTCSTWVDVMKGTLTYKLDTLWKTGYVDQMDIIHIYMHSRDGLVGRGILDFAKNVLELSAYTDKALRDYMASGMQMEGIIKSTQPGRLSPTQRQDIRTKWKNVDSNVRVLEAGLDYQQVQSSAKEAELQANRLFNLEEVARFFNISPVLLGDYSKISLNTLEAIQREFVTHTLSPIIIALEEELNRKLIYPTDKKKYKFDIDEEYIIQSDTQSLANYITTLSNNGIITKNEARYKFGMTPIDDAAADKLIIPYTDVQQNTITDKDPDIVEQEPEKINEDEENEQI